MASFRVGCLLHSFVRSFCAVGPCFPSCLNWTLLPVTVMWGYFILTELLQHIPSVFLFVWSVMTFPHNILDTQDGFWQCTHKSECNSVSTHENAPVLYQLKTHSGPVVSQIWWEQCFWRPRGLFKQVMALWSAIVVNSQACWVDYMWAVVFYRLPFENHNLVYLF